MSYILVQYSVAARYGNPCDRAGCDEPGDYLATANNGRLTDRLCARHVAQHMRGTAYALDPDPEPETIEAIAMNELDKWR